MLRKAPIQVKVDNTTSYDVLAATGEPFDLVIQPSAEVNVVKKIVSGSLPYLRTIYLNKMVSMEIKSIVSDTYSEVKYLDDQAILQLVLGHTQSDSHVKDAEAEINDQGMYCDGMSAFNALPLELLVLIASYLSPNDLARLFLTNKGIKFLFDTHIVLNEVTSQTFDQFDDQIIFNFAKSRVHDKLRQTLKNQIDYMLETHHGLKQRANDELVDAVLTYNKDIAHDDELPMLDKYEITRVISFIQGGELMKKFNIYLGFMNQSLVNKVIFRKCTQFQGAEFTSTFDPQTEHVRVDITIKFSHIYHLVISGNFKFKDVHTFDGSFVTLNSLLELNKMKIKVHNLETNHHGAINLLWIMRIYANKHLLVDLKNTGILLSGLDPLTNIIICDDPHAFFAYCDKYKVNNRLSQHILFNGHDRSLISVLLENRSYKIIIEYMNRNTFHMYSADLYWQAIRDGQLEIVKDYISKKNQHYHNTKSRLGLLFYIVSCRQPQILEYVLANLPDIKDIISFQRAGRRKQGETVLHMAINATLSETNRSILQALFEMAMLLIEYGINTELVDGEGKKALDRLESRYCKLTQEQVNAVKQAVPKAVHAPRDIPSLKQQVIRHKFYFSTFDTNVADVTQMQKDEQGDLHRNKRQKLEQQDPRMNINFLLGNSN